MAVRAAALAGDRAGTFATAASAPPHCRRRMPIPRTRCHILHRMNYRDAGSGCRGWIARPILIASEFTADGLHPLPGQPDFFQTFDYTTQAGPERRTRLLVGSTRLVDGHRLSADAFFQGGKIRRRGGVRRLRRQRPEEGYDDYAGIDVKGKVVIAMRYEPMDDRGHSRLAPGGDLSGWSEHATFSAKTNAAADHGAAALLLVNPPDSEPDLLIPFSGTFATPATIAVFQIKQSAVDQILSAAGAGDLKTLRDKINASFKPRSQILAGQTVSGEVRINLFDGSPEERRRRSSGRRAARR